MRRTLSKSLRRPTNAFGAFGKCFTRATIDRKGARGRGGSRGNGDCESSGAFSRVNGEKYSTIHCFRNVIFDLSSSRLLRCVWIFNCVFFLQGIQQERTENVFFLGFKSVRVQGQGSSQCCVQISGCATESNYPLLCFGKTHYLNAAEKEKL